MQFDSSLFHIFNHSCPVIFFGIMVLSFKQICCNASFSHAADTKCYTWSKALMKHNKRGDFCAIICACTPYLCSACTYIHTLAWHDLNLCQTVSHYSRTILFIPNVAAEMQQDLHSTEVSSRLSSFSLLIFLLLPCCGLFPDSEQLSPSK